MTMTANDPTAAARGIAERLIGMMASEVDAFVIATHQAEQGKPHDPEATRQRISDSREQLARNAVNDIDGIDLRTGFIDLRTARDAEARIQQPRRRDLHPREWAEPHPDPLHPRRRTLPRHPTSAPASTDTSPKSSPPRPQQPRPTSTPTPSSTPTASERHSGPTHVATEPTAENHDANEDDAHPGLQRLEPGLRRPRTRLERAELERDRRRPRLQALRQVREEAGSRRPR